MRPNPQILLLGLLGCGDESTETTRLQPIVADKVMGIALHDAVGSDTVAVPIRQINSYGAAIPGGQVSIAVRSGGSIAGNQLEFDATGYATALIEVPTGQVAEVQVQTATETEVIGPAAFAFGTGAGLPELPLPINQLVDTDDESADFIAPGTKGVAVGAGDKVWYVPMIPGHPPHPVANLPFYIDGMWASHIDQDGVLDLAVWADTQVVLLRGRAGGGYGWGGAWTAGDRDVAGVTATDVNGDRIADLVVGISGTEDSMVEVLMGEGQWDFSPTDPLELSFPIEGVTAADDDRNGDPDITVLSGASGVLHRYTITDDGWVGGTPPEIAQYKAEPGSVLLPPVDLNDEGAPEIAVVGPSEPDAQELVFYVLGEPPTKYPLTFGRFNAAFADLDGDGSEDLLALEDGIINAIRFDGDEEKFISQSTVGMGYSGPIAARDYTGDGRADLAILREGVTLRAGIEPSSGGWSVESMGFRSYNVGLTGPVFVGDFVDNGKVDVVGVIEESSIPTIAGWWFVEGGDGPAVQRAGAVPTQPGLLLDVAHCGQNVYALVYGAEGPGLHRIRINNSGGNFALENKWLNPIAVDAEYLACGSATSSVFGVAAANGNGDWWIFKNDKTEVASGNVGPTGGIVMADTDGDGADEVHSCRVIGCEMAAADFNGDGLDEIITSNFETWVDSAGGSQRLDSRGMLHIVDIDGDGWLDLTVYDDDSGVFSVHRGMSNGLAPAVSMRTERTTKGNGFLGDVDRDGDLEFVTANNEGKLIHSRTSD
jgi:hypothetical protein